MKILNYKIIEQIYDSNNSLVYRAVRDEDSLPVILKVLKEDYPTPEELTRYRQEYDITCLLADMDGVVKVYDLVKYQNTLIIVLEDFGGESLKQCITEHPLSINTFLNDASKSTGFPGVPDFEIGLRIEGFLEFSIEKIIKLISPLLGGDRDGLPAVWLIHLAVGDLAESLRRVGEGGGKV